MDLTGPLEMEAILLDWHTSSGNQGHWVKFKLPTAINEGHPFAEFPRGSEHGQRFRIEFVPIADDETSPRSAMESVPVGLPAKASGESRAASTGAGGLPNKRKWSDMKWVKRFGILCADHDFVWFIWFHTGGSEGYRPTPEDAAQLVRDYCLVKSRRDIDGNPEAEQRAAVLLAEWDAHTGRIGRP